MPSKVCKTYIIHLSTAFERKKHMDLQLFDKQLDFEFIIQGDLSEMSEQIEKKYFTGELSPLNRASSCAYKHIISYEKMIENEVPLALILEDDIMLDAKFDEKLKLILLEIDRRKMKNMIISLEDSNLKYVLSSEKNATDILYQKKEGRFAGAYLIDLLAATKICEEIYQNKCDYPIDWYHNQLAKKGAIDIWWSTLILATQGSLNGYFPSLIDKKQFGIWRKISFILQKMYKKILYRFR